MILAPEQLEPVLIDEGAIAELSDSELYELAHRRGLLVPTGTFSTVDYSVVDPVVDVIDRLQAGGGMQDISVQVHAAESFPFGALSDAQLTSGGLIAFFRARSD